MQPGTWGELVNMNGFNNGAVLAPPNGGSLLEYTNRASWNPFNKTLMILGGAHTSSSTGCNETRFVKYTESTNTWTSTLPNPCPNFDNAFGGGIGHAYNHNAIDSSRGDFYHRQYASGKVMVFTHATQTWSQIPPIPRAFQVAGALEYFPNRNSLVFLDGEHGVWEFDLDSNAWTQRASTGNGGFTPQLTGLGPYHNLSQYSSLCQCVLLGGGGGSQALYKFGSNGSITRMANTPFDLEIPQSSGGSAWGSVMTVDPASGLILAWNSNGTGYEFNPVANTYRTTGLKAPFTPTTAGGIFNVVAAPVADHGVVIFVVSGSSSKVFLYKHSTN